MKVVDSTQVDSGGFLQETREQRERKRKKARILLAN
jgi:hypothetical protein